LLQTARRPNVEPRRYVWLAASELFTYRPAGKV